LSRAHGAPQTRARAHTIAAHGDIMKVTVRQGVQDVDRDKVYAAGASPGCAPLPEFSWPRACLSSAGHGRSATRRLAFEHLGAI